MNKVKKLVKYIVFTGKNDEVEYQYKSFVQEFDERGNITKEVEYSSGGQIEKVSKYKYDTENRLVEEGHYYEEELGEVIRYRLDEEGKRREVETTYADGSKSVKKVIRHENAITLKTFDEDGDIEEDWIKYDEKGRVIEEIKLNDEGKIANRNVYEYNEKGNLTAKTEYKSDDDSFIKILIEYNDKDNPVSETTVTNRGGIVNRISFGYNEQGECTTWQNKNYIHYSEYDDQHRIVKEETRNRFTNLIENFTEYKYNDRGLVAEECTFRIGEQYKIEAFGGLYGRNASDYVITKYEYEFFEE